MADDAKGKKRRGRPPKGAVSESPRTLAMARV